MKIPTLSVDRQTDSYKQQEGFRKAALFMSVVDTLPAQDILGSAQHQHFFHWLQDEWIYCHNLSKTFLVIN